MKFTLSWLKTHLDTAASVAEVAEAMTMAGLEVEHVDDPSAKLAAFSVARVIEAVQHPNADRLRVCQVETKDGLKEIVCGAPNARAGLFTVYAPIGTYIPGSGITLEPRPVRGVVSNGMLCSASELQTAEESDGILELAEAPVGTPAAQALGLEAVIDFEVTPNRPDWLGVAGIARDLAAAGLGTLRDQAVTPVSGKFPCPIDIRVDGSDACPAFAGRVIRGLKNGPSPAWMQELLRAIGLRPINALVDVTNFLSYDRGRPLHVYDAAKITGGFVEARLGRGVERIQALDGKTYEASADMCVIADGSGAIGLGGVMGGESTGSQLGTTDVFIESAWFDPIRTAQAGRDLALVSDAQYRFARGVDPGFIVPGLELATQLILEMCGGEPSEIRLAGEIPAPPPVIAWDPDYVERLSGLALPNSRIRTILETLGFVIEGTHVRPPTWRRDVEGRADLVEEVARIAGYDALPAEPLPPMARPASGVLTLRQTRLRAARRALAAAGYAEALTFSFVAQATAKLFGGGADELVLANPISPELDCMRPSVLPSLIEAAGRNARRGFADCALFEIGPVFAGTEPGDERTAIAAVLAPHGPRRWDHGSAEDVFAIKADLMALLDELGAPVANLQVAQADTTPWWRPGRAARLQLGPKAVLAEFGEIHPKALAALNVAGPIYAFEIWAEAIPEPKKKAVKTRPALALSPLMPLARDFAFVVGQDTPAGDIVRAVQSADRRLIASVRVFDVYEGAGVGEGRKSVAVEVTIQPREKTLAEAEIEALSARIRHGGGQVCGGDAPHLSCASFAGQGSAETTRMDANGYVARGYEGVRDAFAQAQASDEGGGQLCVYRHGEKVVDLWAGRDTVNDRPYGQEIITVIMSCTKGATAAVVHRLAERGLIDYEAPVADYWPGFAAGGKSDARIWHLMSHSVGLPGVDPESGVTAHDMLYAERHVPALEAMAPVWTPGASCHYHPITYGSLLDAVVRRVTGKSVGRVFDEEFRAPLGLDFWIGLPEAQESRVAPHFQVGPAASADQLTALIAGMGVDVSTRLAKVVLHSFKHTTELIEDMNNREARAAEVPAGNGVADAASLAKMYASMIGEVGGMRLLKPETVEKARTLRTGQMSPAGDLDKLQFGAPVRYGLGFEFARDVTPMLGEGSFGHAGAGGRIGFAHPESGVAAAYVANTMLTVMGAPDPRWSWMEELRKAVGG